MKVDMPLNQTFSVCQTQSAIAVEYADCISADGEELSPIMCPRYISKNVMVKIQSETFETCGVLYGEGAFNA